MTDNAAFDQERIESISAALDLRPSNREALESIAFAVGLHFQIEGRPPPFRGVVDSATGAGKTYILAATIDYFAAERVRNFVVIAPGRTILSKTVANFTVGHPKSLLGGMETQPVVITSENFASPAMRSAMDDPEQVKLYIFTVQALVRPKTKLGRRTHKFQEGLGQAFYERLEQANDLVVLADEHHVYFGTAFSNAVEGLRPHVLIGLTATPHRDTPEEQIIYRYPLAAAIADRVVKTPVLVGRKDDRSDPTTKLLDGIALLERKERAVERYVAESGAQPVHPIMLVVAQGIAEAKELQGIISDPSFVGGRYAERVLTVHSDAPDEALADLDKLDDPESRYRIVISVGMLKEGWDNKSVYVIASMRASVSTILTEQTLGRGLRLPFGQYTDYELLDTLEVLGHEKYEELLKRAGVLNEEFINRRTRAVLKKNAEGELVPTIETTEVAPVPVAASQGDTTPAPADGSDGRPVIASVEDYITKADQQVQKLQVELYPRDEFSVLQVPLLKMGPPTSEFSLADITDVDPFRKLGQRIAADPVGELRRTTLGARLVTGPDGRRRTQLVTAEAVDKVVSTGRVIPLEAARDELLNRVLAAPAVSPRPKERLAAAPLVSAFMDGLGGKAEDLLSNYLDRATALFVAQVTAEQRRWAAKPTYSEVVELVPFSKTRTGRPETSTDRTGAFKKGIGYEGYQRSLYAQDWFDSSTERTVANVLDAAGEIRFWVRLQRGDLPILWTGAGSEYNPDFIAVEGDDTHWVIEAKMDKEVPSAEVQGKREAARRWSNYVSADASVEAPWRYLLLSETDVKTAKGSWPALKKLGG